ncbi:zinc transporter ZIP11 isoform X1 [Anabrus simplex]|uniref:zinc transporter ZIP11 isoform X1 n=1 Tax=Anabrus simplex TaxID=316456 RepID=UPI0034DD7380
MRLRGCNVYNDTHVVNYFCSCASGIKMISSYGPVAQALLGTLLTWGLTAAGAALVLIFNGKQQKLLDASLGFAGGIMVAASYWSLLDPAIEIAEESQLYGKNGEYSFIPVALGFLLGAGFVYCTDIVISTMGINSLQVMLGAPKGHSAKETAVDLATCNRNGVDGPWLTETSIEGFQDGNYQSSASSRRRNVNSATRNVRNSMYLNHETEDSNTEVILKNSRWKRILLLIVAVTIHNIPEGLAVGVGFGAIGISQSATFESARNLAIGIGIQNFPEGLAVSLPLKAAGFSTWKSFWYGQLSGMVEPVFGVLGAATVGLAQPILPYALAFAAGAMIYVVVDDIIPEAHASGNGQLATWGAIIGFVIMMILDVGLG